MVHIVGGSVTDIFTHAHIAIVDAGGALRVFDPSGASPTVNTSSGVYVIAGSTIILGSVQTFGGTTTGSTEVYSLTGSVNVYGNLSTTAGSESYVKGGSIQTYSPLGSQFILGSVYSTGSINIVSPSTIGSYTRNIGSEIWIFGSIYSTGSINVVSPSTIGSYTSQALGSVAITNIGSSLIVNSRFDLGSFLLVAGSISSMPSISVVTGSESYIKGGSIQTYTPLGSTFVTGSIYVTGSINQISNWMVSGLQYSVGISGLMAVSGIINQGTTPWVISGTANISGVFIGISGIVNQGTVNWGVSGTAFQTIVSTYPVVAQDYSGAGHTTTGSKLLWSPLAGSKAQLLSFSVSSDVPQRLSLYFSGTVVPANRQIWAVRLPASGGAGMNLLGILCSGPVDAALGLVVNVTGNIESTVWCRSLA